MPAKEYEIVEINEDSVYVIRILPSISGLRNLEGDHIELTRGLKELGETRLVKSIVPLISGAHTATTGLIVFTEPKK